MVNSNSKHRNCSYWCILFKHYEEPILKWLKASRLMVSLLPCCSVFTEWNLFWTKAFSRQMISWLKLLQVVSVLGVVELDHNMWDLEVAPLPLNQEEQLAGVVWWRQWFSLQSGQLAKMGEDLDVQPAWPPLCLGHNTQTPALLRTSFNESPSHWYLLLSEPDK